ncbi:MAG TPA: hypothetical protein VMO00_16755 [Methylomirabilota bacterium]|nr:hypothetical protein [Methylomirabilota bacterium]
MGKKAKQRRQESVQEPRPDPLMLSSSIEAPGKKRVVFAVGDADYGYTEGKILRLAQRLKEHTGWNIVTITHDDETFEGSKRLALDARRVDIESPGVTVADRLRSTDEMIRETADVTIPGSDLLLWKVLAMDDFLSSLQLYGAIPTSSLEDAGVVVVPLMAVDNNTRATCGLYTWIVSEAQRKGIPVVGLEVSPLGNKNTLSQLPADHYAVKSHWSKEFLVGEKLAVPDQVSVLRWEESYFLWPGRDDYTEAYVERDAKAREMLGIPWDEFVVLIPHHVAFLWEARKILEALGQVGFPVHVVIRVDPRTTRRHFPEREIVLQSYGKEIRSLHHVVIDERIGVGLLLQLADLVIAPFAGTTTERAALCRKPTIVCQALGQEGWRGEFVFWEPNPEKIPDLIGSWQAKGWLQQARMARIVATLLDRGSKRVMHKEPPFSHTNPSVGEDLARLAHDLVGETL